MRYFFRVLSLTFGITTGLLLSATVSSAESPRNPATQALPPLQTPPSVEPSAADAKKDGNSRSEGSKPGLLKFNFKYQPWSDVLDWFADQGGYSLVLDNPPKGTFNYRDDHAYTPAEAIDILNSVLLTKGYTLVIRDRMLLVVNVEDTIPPSLVTRVPAEELDGRGKYELVSTRFQLKNLGAEDAQKEINELVGPQGKVVVLPKARQLVVVETSGRLREIRDVLERADRSRDPGRTGGSMVRSDDNQPKRSDRHVATDFRNRGRRQCHGRWFAATGHRPDGPSNTGFRESLADCRG